MGHVKVPIRGRLNLDNEMRLENKLGIAPDFSFQLSLGISTFYPSLQKNRVLISYQLKYKSHLYFCLKSAYLSEE